MDRGTLTRLSMQRLSKRFKRNKEYNKVDDVNDTRVPLHNEDIFQHGIKFKAKFIGTLEIARPQSKIDIITAMRRIRYEYKVKGIKKQRCLLEISTNGVCVSKRRRGVSNKEDPWGTQALMVSALFTEAVKRKKDVTDDELLLMQHPIYRIFYVSHDSQDLKIFSYITRESTDNSFQCNVFKAYKKRMALHVVRSLGQAFDVCHKKNPRQKKKKSSTDKTLSADDKKEEITEPRPQDGSVPVESDEGINTGQDVINSTANNLPLNSTLDNGTPPLINFDPFAPLAPPPPAELLLPNMVVPAPLPPYVSRPRPKPGQSTIQENPLTASTDSLGGRQPNEGSVMSPSVSLGDPINETDGGNNNEWLVDRERQQTNMQLALLQEQLQSEKSSRVESEARVEHLLLQNKELLSHLQKLMIQLQQLQEFQMSQQQNQRKTATPPPAVIPDSTQTPPTTEPEETSSEITNQKTEDTSHDQSNLIDSSPNGSHDLSKPSKEINFDEAFKTSNNNDQQETTLNDEDPFQLPLPLLNDDDDKQRLDAAFTPIET